jgi:hypothetical protein
MRKVSFPKWHVNVQKFTLAALAAVSMAACSSQDACQKQYDTAGEVRACQIGAEQVAERIRTESGNLTGHSGHVACSNRCGRRYNPDTVDQADMEALGEMTDLFVACTQACKVRLQWEANMAASIMDAGANDYACEQIAIGGAIRCI